MCTVGKMGKDNTRTLRDSKGNKSQDGTGLIRQFITGNGYIYIEWNTGQIICVGIRSTGSLWGNEIILFISYKPIVL